MLILGPLGEATTRRAQVLHWAQFLDQVNLFWWEHHRRTSTIRIARERMEAGAPPRGRLEHTVHIGMRKCALHYPYVYWGAGPWGKPPEKQAAGFWPKRAMIGRQLEKGVIAYATQRNLHGAIYAKGQKYWLYVERKQYTLYDIATNALWRMHARWSSIVRDF